MHAHYRIRRTHTPPALDGNWNSPVWKQAPPLRVKNFHPESSKALRPRTSARLLYDDANIYVIFRVDDPYVRSTRLRYQSSVCCDSCVEFFVSPAPLDGKSNGNGRAHADAGGYFNIEINAGGTLLLYWIKRSGTREDFTRRIHRVPASVGKTVRIFHSMPRRVSPPVTGGTTWYIEYAVPLALFSRYLGPLHIGPGARWRANLYKCGDKTRAPHWASWSPIGEELNFHRPEYFGVIEFE